MDPERSVSYFHARYTGNGAFYTGLGRGCPVLLEQNVRVNSHQGKRRASVGLYIQSLLEPGAWLCLGDDCSQLEDVVPLELAVHGRKAHG